MSCVMHKNKNHKLLFFDIDHLEIVVHIIFRFVFNLFENKNVKKLEVRKSEGFVTRRQPSHKIHYIWIFI